MQDEFYISRTKLLLLILLAYTFSFVIRLIWVFQFQDNPSFFWENQLMINTNDGYFFASGAQEVLNGMHLENPRIPDIWIHGIVFFTVFFAKITPFSLETITLYMPAIISSLVVIPIILIARLYKQTLWGFFAALLGSIAWSYYNRTMIGYYDTDMFSAMAPMFILFFLIKSTIDFKFKTALYAAIVITIYPFLYDSGLSIVYAMGIIYAIYMIFYYPKENTTYLSLILVFMALLPFPFSPPLSYIIKIMVLIALYNILKKVTIRQKQLMLITVGIFLIFLIFGNVFGLILTKISNYMATGTKDEGLHFYAVVQTVREAGKIPFEVFANRVSGSQVGVIFALIGYIVLVFHRRAFILALPLIGIGIFALWGGLRFTVYAVPIAAMSAIYLLYVIGRQFKDKKLQYAFIVVGTLAMLYPNIKHIIEYKVPTVFNKSEVVNLVKLDDIANSNDYTLTWWDYGYPIWYYSDTSTLIDGGKHHNDNFIISKILTTDSQIQAANLARLSVETYVDSNYSIVADTIFRNHKKDQLNPNEFLTKLKSDEFKLPNKSRDIYIYLPYKMLGIFPTVSAFSNLDLTTGEKLKQSFFYSTNYFTEKGNLLNLSNGLVLDKQNSVLTIGNNKTQLKRFVIVEYDKTGKLKKNIQKIDPNSNISIIFMRNYNTFLVLDESMYNSLYIKLFVLEEFDVDLFELVIKSPYSKIYKLKI